MSVILAICPYTDDIELRCFGTMALFKKEGNEILFFVLSKREGATNKSDRTLDSKKIAAFIDANLYIESLPDRFISKVLSTISILEIYVEMLNPDIVFMPTGKDTRQDHRATFNVDLVGYRL